MTATVVIKDRGLGRPSIYTRNQSVTPQQGGRVGGLVNYSRLGVGGFSESPTQAAPYAIGLPAGWAGGGKSQAYANAVLENAALLCNVEFIAKASPYHQAMCLVNYTGVPAETLTFGVCNSEWLPASDVIVNRSWLSLIFFNFFDEASTTRQELQNENLSSFLNSVYSLSRSDKARFAVDEIIEYLDDLLLDDRFDEVDAALANADPQKLTDPLIVSFLGITHGAKNRLKSRFKFFENAQRVVAIRRGSYDAAKRLLAKYL